MERMEKRNTDIIAVIPAYNESETIQSVLSSLIGSGVYCIVVDDGSVDDTFTIAQASGACVLRHFINLGQGAAIQTGFEKALTLSPKVVITYDADGQFDTSDIPALIQPIFSGDCEVVLGSRFLKKQNIPFLRKGLLRLGTLFTRVTTGLFLTDTHNGLKAISSSVLPLFKLQQPRMAHASEILHIIADNSLSYTEVPVTVRYTEYSQKKGQKTIDSFRVLFDLLFRR